MTSPDLDALARRVAASYASGLNASMAHTLAADIAAHLRAAGHAEGFAEGAKAMRLRAQRVCDQEAEAASANGELEHAAGCHWLGERIAAVPLPTIGDKSS